jgi:hypothetical protein
VETSVNAVPSTSLDQLLSGQWTNLNSIMDSDNRYQEHEIPSMQAYSTSPADGFAPQDSYRTSEQVSQGDIISRRGDNPFSLGRELPSMFPSTGPYFPDQNDYWPESIQSGEGHGQHAGYLASLQAPTLRSSGFPPMATFQHASASHPDFMSDPSYATRPRYGDCNAAVSEMTPTIPPSGTDISTRRSSQFDSPGSSGVRVHTVPDHFDNGHIPPQGLKAQGSGSWLDFLPGEVRNLSWDSQPLPSQVQYNLGQLTVNPMDIDLLALANGSGNSFGAGTDFQPEFNTFGGYGQPSSSSNGTAMMTKRSQGSTFDQTTHLFDTFHLSTLESPLSSSHFLSSQSDIFSNEHFSLHESTPHPLQLNSQLILSPQPFQTSTSRPSTTSMSRCQSCVSDHVHI